MIKEELYKKTKDLPADMEEEAIRNIITKLSADEFRRLNIELQINYDPYIERIISNLESEDEYPTPGLQEWEKI
jgi:hypothetical protein